MTKGTKILTLTAVAALGAGALVLQAAPSWAQGVSGQESYQLVQVAGNALPTQIEQEGDCREEVLSGTLTLDTDGGWELVTRERETCGDQVEEEEESETGAYRAEGDVIRFMDDDEDDDRNEAADDDDGELDLDDLATGTRSGDGLTVTLEDGQTVLVFRR